MRRVVYKTKLFDESTVEFEFTRTPSGARIQFVLDLGEDSLKSFAEGIILLSHTLTSEPMAAALRKMAAEILEPRPSVN